METSASDLPHPLADLVSFLFTRREMILNSWRTACEEDPMLSKISALSREEFNDLLPVVLSILEQRLLGQPTEADLHITATSHGLHRWHRSHILLETLQELDHLERILYDELQKFQELFPRTDARLLLQVHREIAIIMSETIAGSAQKHDELQRLEAANRASALQQALSQMSELSRQRGDILRSSSHDLRSSFGLINSAAYLLRMEGLTDEQRNQYVEMLNRNLTTVESMLNSLMDLARLEAGEEVVDIQSIDAAQLLQQMVASAQPMASERGLVLWADGPDTLPVETDPIKLRRIVQNILLNALRYTNNGFISVSWSRENDSRWVFGIQDSGPGLQDGLTNLLTQQLKPTVEPTTAMGPDQSEPVPVLPSDVHEIPDGPGLAQAAASTPKGEGVGLHIVKRLCDLLDANLDIESREGRGTLFRIRLPMQYER